jgi:uncharacterized membrane protein YfcA
MIIPTAHIIILLITGTSVGFAIGLLGLGGGPILIPVQYILYTDAGIPTDTAVKLSFGTTLLVILPIAISGALRHHKKGAVQWRVAFVMGGCGVIAAYAGATLAAHLPGAALKIVFGVVAVAIAIRMLTAKSPETKEEEPVSNPWLWAAWAIPIGLFTGILGIGGGILMIPILTLALKLRMHSAVATSLAIMMFNAASGAIGYIINGLNAPNLPAYSLGYVHLPTWFLLTVTGIGMAQLGAVTAHRLPAKQLRYMFIAVVFYMGLRMIGVFDWLGWPI